MSVAPGFLHSIWANTQERGHMAWSDWQSSITRAYQTPVCNYPGLICWWDLICARIMVTEMFAEWATAPLCDPFIIFISAFAPANSPECTHPLSHSPTHPLTLSAPAHCSVQAFVHRLWAINLFFSYADFDINIWHLVHGLPSSCNLWLRKSKVFCLGGSCIFVVPFEGRFPYRCMFLEDIYMKIWFSCDM